MSEYQPTISELDNILSEVTKKLEDHTDNKQVLPNFLKINLSEFNECFTGYLEKTTRTKRIKDEMQVSSELDTFINASYKAYNNKTDLEAKLTKFSNLYNYFRDGETNPVTNQSFGQNETNGGRRN